jgi:RNA polymerase sigma-70 factor (ECF subfamily)
MEAEQRDRADGVPDGLVPQRPAIHGQGMSATKVLEQNRNEPRGVAPGEPRRRVGGAMDECAEDQGLMARIAQGQDVALRALFLRHQNRVFRFIQRIVRNEAVADELTNEVFLDVWQHARSFEGRSSVTTWILAMAHNRAVSALRKRREEAWNEDEAHEIPDGADNSEVVVQKADKGRLLRQCLDALPPAQREIMDLVYYHERSIAEVSTILGLPEGTVKTKMFNARKRLSELLKAAGVDRGWP